jgi:hypothetical protein
MTETCVICQHAQRSLIDAELAAGLKPSVISARYRIRKMLIEHHTEHISPHEADTKVSNLVDATHDASMQALSTHRALPQALKDRLARNALRDQALPDMVVTENPFSQFKQAWQLAKDDDRMRAHMVAYINEQLQAEDIGLP